MKSKFSNNKIARFLATSLGRRVLNIAYSWGAAVVIIGALFKLLHWPFGDQMLFIGMMTEFFVFFISGFEQPEEPYQWERVFPELGHNTTMSAEEMEQRRAYISERAAEAHRRAENPNYIASASSEVTTAAPNVSLAGILPEEQVTQLASSIQRLGLAVDQLACLGELTANMTHQWEDFHLDKERLGRETQAYQEQITALNNNLNSLNSAYEAQLRDVTGQVDAIEGINRGLDHLRQMYDGCVMDSNLFRNENARMARQLQDLNMVYARLLDAMTVNMSGMRPYGGYNSSYTQGDPYVSPRREGYPPREDYTNSNN